MAAHNLTGRGPAGTLASLREFSTEHWPSFKDFKWGCDFKKIPMFAELQP